jgi:hypothetical protein
MHDTLPARWMWTCSLAEQEAVSAQNTLNPCTKILPSQWACGLANREAVYWDGLRGMDARHPGGDVFFPSGLHKVHFRRHTLIQKADVW